MQILFILSGNLSTSPRALKNIISLRKKHEIKIIAINRANIWKEKDVPIIKTYQLNYLSLDLIKNNSLIWWKASIKQKIAQRNNKLHQNSKKNAYASEKASAILSLYLSNLNENFDLIFAHSYGSIFPAFEYSQKMQIPFIIDIEDYYPGEKIALSHTIEKQRREYILKQILPKAKHLLYASPLIGLYTIKLLQRKKVPQHSLINNSFPKNEFVFKNTDSERIEFVWFSQTIDKGRGLEFILPMLNKFNSKINFTIYGELNSDFYQNELKKYSFITIKKSIPQKQLHQKLSNYDIGLALELKSTDLNRNIALTNKIFAYAQSGLYILATNTDAQLQFINNHKNSGIVCEQENLSNCEQKIVYIIENIKKIRQNKKQRFLSHQKLAWETEANKLHSIISTKTI